MEASASISRSYETLAIPPGASQFEAKRAYRRLAKEWHPDRFVYRDDRLRYEAEERMKEINEAYHAVISRYPVPARTNRQRQGSAAGHFRYGTQGIGAGFSGPYMGVQTQIRKKAKAEARRNFCIMSFLMVGGFAFFALSSMLVWWLLPYAMFFVYG